MSQLMVEDGLARLLTSNLGLKVGEHLAFIHDSAFTSLIHPIERYCAESGVHLRIVALDYDGIQPLPKEIKDLLLSSQYGVILFGVVHNIWHEPERKTAKYELKKRIASIVCAPARLNQSAPPESIPRIASATQELFKLLTPGASVRIASPAGCEFIATVKTPFWEHGQYDVPGTGGDFPAGEAGFGPEEFSVHGQIVYDLKVQHLGLLESPLVLTVERDRIVNVAGHHSRAFHELVARRGEVLNYISEISIGMNPFVGVTPEREFIPEEKTYGTAHCGHGGNASYGHRTGPHIDGVIKTPLIEINGVRVMEEGRFQSGLTETGDFDWLEDTHRRKG